MVSAKVVIAALLVGLAGCGPKGPVVSDQVNQMLRAATKDAVAVAFLDCNELKYVAFFNGNGEADLKQVIGTASLMDLQVRLAQVPYERVHFIANDRPCGFQADETVS